MNKFWFKLEDRGLSVNPGKNWIFVFFKNSLRNKQLKFSTISPFIWSSASVELKTRSPWLESDLYEVTPLNPLMHPVKDESV